MAVTPYHHGITALEPISGAVPITTTATAVIGLIAVANDADETVYPLNTPVLVTSITRGLAAAGYDGNLRKSLEAIQPITNPTVVVVRVANPFGQEVFDDSLIIGTTQPDGQRTGIQALLTAKSKLGVTPKILSAPDVETPDVVQALIAVAKKLRAFAYVTPRDTNGVMLPTKESVVAYRDTLGAREVELIWPEWTSGNVLLGVDLGEPQPPGGHISCAGATSVLTWNEAFGRCDVEVDGVLYPANVDGKEGLVDFINSHPSLGVILAMDSFSNDASVTYTLRNLDSVNHRIRLIWIDKQGHVQGGIASFTGLFSNPTTEGIWLGDIFTDNACLAAATIT